MIRLICVFTLALSVAISADAQESDESTMEPDIVLSQEQSVRWIELSQTCGEMESESCKAAFRSLLDDKQKKKFDRLVDKPKKKPKN